MNDDKYKLNPIEIGLYEDHIKYRKRLKLINRKHKILQIACIIGSIMCLILAIFSIIYQQNIINYFTK